MAQPLLNQKLHEEWSHSTCANSAGDRGDGRGNGLGWVISPGEPRHVRGEIGRTAADPLAGWPYFWIPPPGPGGSLCSVGETSLPCLRLKSRGIAIWLSVDILRPHAI